MLYEHIPEELRNIPNWCCWRADPDPSKPGKIKKTPINAKTGGMAQSNNSDTWCDFNTAVSASSNFSGIGFMFSNSGCFGVDIDHAENAIEDYRHEQQDADNIISEFIYTLQSYAEYSQSGTGIHIICRGKLPPTGRRRKNVEMYDSGRFFVMTGNYASEFAEISECTERIKPLHEKYIGGGTVPSTGISAPLPLNLSEAEIIKLAEESKQGDTFRTLYAGIWDTLYNSQSEADLALCNMLAFWCRCDEQLMDKLFRSSGLMREKWDRKQSGSTYGQFTIKKAVKDCKRVYEPKTQYHITIGQPQAKPKKKLYTFDDTGNAERFSDTFGERVRYSYINKSWIYFDGRKWCFDVTGAIYCMADEVISTMKDDMDYFIQNAPESWGDSEQVEKSFMKHLKQSRSNRSKESMIKELQHHVSITPDQMDIHKSLLCTPNGIINLRTGELIQHDREKYITKITNTEYTDKIDHPLWDKFLDDIFNGDKDLIRYIQKAVGYSLTGSTQEQCAFFCYGEGNNGKSTFIDVITNMLGDYVSNIQAKSLIVKSNSGSSSSEDIARLKGARFVTSSESNEGARLDESLIKQLTGGDKVTASRKYEHEFEFYPEFKLWMSTNHKPIIRGTDKGIWRRVRLIPFTVCIPPEKVDKNLKYKLEQELPGIMKWAVDGCLMWQREGLKIPVAIQQATAEYQSEMDTVGAFINDCCTVGEGYSEKAQSLFKAYLEWAKENNEYEKTSTAFGREIAKRFEKQHTKQGTMYSGIALQDNFRPYSVQFG
ncbi:MAG TPA: phage/plasmid primase, P4 family [Oscillospiraceae bacterium]|nr:phage/plasmid primase, P4 family [Oscillospiraceae bacterium]